MTCLTLTPEESGQRLDQYLAQTVEGLTRSGAQKLLEEGQVTVNGKSAKKNARLTQGDCVEVQLPDPAPVDVVPQDIPLDVVYEDSDVIVVNKPVGMVVHPAPGHPDGTLVNALLYACGDSLSGINGALRPGIVHRIDRDTSGLLIVAKNDAAHLALSDQLQDHSLSRTYEAVIVAACGGCRYGRCPHRPPSHRPETDGGAAGGTACGDPLEGTGPLSGLHPHPVSAGDRTHPSDSGASVSVGVSAGRRPVIRRRKRAGTARPARLLHCAATSLYPSGFAVYQSNAKGSGLFLEESEMIYTDITSRALTYLLKASRACID